ncbi:zinc finger CCCH domain-containing protein 43 isoform X1 [Gastrolobium bilobum]|uniref:zinc finger CCCH domain-containing protein 43 isoform X1 n=1 Tax=Gastrolobium bilobum TaxID=150636 RepID=UPI002AB1DA8D|nr:zinc finger CCCH domain-containing protein 43 isoform X1 [Gastrolobium bilobum]
MEPSESDSAVVSNGKDPELGSEWAPSSPVAHHPQPSDLNHVAEEDPLGEELQNKLDLKGGGDGGEQVLDFNDGGGICDEESVKGDDGGGVCDEESDKGERCDGDSKGWETNSWDENVNHEVGWDDVDGDGVEKNEDESRDGTQHHYPLRPDAEDCAFYMKTGTCKFGFNCKFNHPIRRKNQAVKEKAGEREELAERSGQTECKYYLSSGGCKFGKACKYNHTRGIFSTMPSLELNFLGLPIRLGEKECPYYMRTGSCKFGANCKFNHPDPTAVGGCDPSSGYGNGGSISLQGAWSSPRTLNETSPFVPMMLSPTRGVSPKSADWNGYQAPVYLSESSMHPPSTYVMNNPALETNIYVHRQKQMAVEEFPERPGEPECSYFLKTGDCKFKSNCKFHHPKNQVAKLPPCNLSDKGLPLRPDQNVCSHYSRYGICKFGPACKFDHPIGSPPLMMPELGQQSYTNSASIEVARMGGSVAASDASIQQSV